MISVSQALDALFALTRSTDVEEVPLIEASGRVLARDVTARRDQPPFAASAMDGYAICESDHSQGQTLEVIGEAPAGHRFSGVISPGQAVRIFTGGVVPEGATRIIIQEDVTRVGDKITLGDRLEEASHIRPAGCDFQYGSTLAASRRLSPEDVALLASMNVPMVPVHRAPKVALISTGDELVMPGEVPKDDQIIASNTFGLHALLRSLGADARLLPIAPDRESGLRLCFDLAQDADLIVTIGGASVGDHDIVAQVMASTNTDAARSFYKVAMRPGKPLMAGRWGGTMMVGLPGNPVSAMVCGHVFLAPVVRAMQGLPAAPAPRDQASLTEDMGPNGPREHYMRALLTADGIRPFARQDSSLLTVLSSANALMVRPPHDGPHKAGTMMPYLPL
ncbi:MAG: molybdopterin molybdotransferase MoeA [Marinovum sp.]|nr:molybdopterin molybdotransferase MoeA [Marinovum sp.]